MDLKFDSIQKIKEYFKIHRIKGYEDYVFSSFYTFREIDLLKIVDKIKKNPNNSGVVQIFIHKTLDKYDFTIPDLKIKKNKSPALTNNERQIKFRNSSKKVNFQCMIDETLKNELIALKDSKNFTYEQLLKYFLITTIKSDS